MRRLFSIILFAGVFLNAAAVTHFEEETLNYKVMFKWGLVQKQAGRATLKLKSSPDAFVATLYARSESLGRPFLLPARHSHLDNE